MRPRLDALAEKYAAIGDVRGRGRDAGRRARRARHLTPNPTLTGAISAACHAEGLITLTAGTYGNVLRFLPPLVIGEDLLTEGLGHPGGRVRGVRLAAQLWHRYRLKARRQLVS